MDERNTQLNGVVTERVAQTIRFYALARSITIGDVIAEMVERDGLHDKLTKLIGQMRKETVQRVDTIESK
jgi:hypothetical protein